MRSSFKFKNIRDTNKCAIYINILRFLSLSICKNIKNSKKMNTSAAKRGENVMYKYLHSMEVTHLFYNSTTMFSLNSLFFF